MESEQIKSKKKKIKKKSDSNKLFGVIPIPENFSLNFDLNEKSQIRFEIGDKKKNNDT